MIRSCLKSIVLGLDHVAGFHVCTAITRVTVRGDCYDGNVACGPSLGEDEELSGCTCIERQSSIEPLGGGRRACQAQPSST